MNIEECAKVLTKIQLGDNRQVDRATLAEWFDSIGGVPFADAVEAVSMHRRESLDYLQPAHIHRNVSRIRSARAEEQKTIEARDGFTGDPAPDNMAALEAAWNDPVAFAREVAIYDQQLVDAGLSPTQPRYERGWAS